MNAFEQILKAADSAKRELGAVHTPAEISQQPLVWNKAASLLIDQSDEITEFCRRAGVLGDTQSNIILTGAGSSEFVGRAVECTLRERLMREVTAIPTTHLVTHAGQALVPQHRYTVVSFARSGNSPESLATYNRVKNRFPNIKQIIITCNGDGKLAETAEGDPDSLCLLLPPETNDKSLAMTSSYSTMALAAIGLAYLSRPDELRMYVARIADAAEEIIGHYADVLFSMAQMVFTRGCYLGSGPLFGTMQECSLKMQEMTNGTVATIHDSYLGVRHGPQAFIRDDCIVCASISSDPLIKQYEIDFLQELKKKRQGCGTLITCTQSSGDIDRVGSNVIQLLPDGAKLPDAFRVVSDVVVGQMLAMFKSIQLGLKPDNPSPSGTIHRVVKGVTIYDSGE